MEKLIDKYEKLLDLKETAQTLYQNEKKEIKDDFDYKNDAKMTNVKINLVKLSAEISLIRGIINDLKGM